MNITPRDVLRKALELKIEAKAANSSVTMEDADNLMKFIMNGKKPLIEKVKVSEIAAELGITSKDVLRKALELKIEVKAANSSLTMEQADRYL